MFTSPEVFELFPTEDNPEKRLDLWGRLRHVFDWQRRIKSTQPDDVIDVAEVTARGLTDLLDTVERS